MSHVLLFIHLDMPSKISQDQMVMQGEALVFFLMTCSKCVKCLMVKKVHLNIQNGVFHGTTTVLDCVLYIISLTQFPILLLMLHSFRILSHTLVLADEMLCITVTLTYILMIQLILMAVSSIICYQALVLSIISPSQHIKLGIPLT